MKKRITGVIPSGVLVLALSCANGYSLQAANQSGRRADRLSSQRQGFFAYVLGKINPEDKDYGASIGAARSSLVEYTIDDFYFWSNVVTLVLLSGLAATVFLQWRAMDKRELIAASLIARLWNGRVSDRIEIERRTEQFNQLIATHNRNVERSLAQRAEPESDLAANLARRVQVLSDASQMISKRGMPPNRADSRANGSVAVDHENAPARGAHRVTAEKRAESQAAPNANNGSS